MSSSVRPICTWLSASQPASGEAFPFPPDIPAITGNQTLRQSLRISTGGQKLQLVFSNRYGTQPLVTGESYLSVPGQYRAIPVTFGGQQGTVIPAGDTLCSDEIALHVPSLSELTLRTFLPEPVPLNTFHWDARRFSLLEPGNRTRQEEAGNGEAVSS
ncbi:TPA: SGNH/GDSL hydrolase family protein, partial [Morganella morganii]